MEIKEFLDNSKANTRLQNCLYAINHRYGISNIYEINILHFKYLNNSGKKTIDLFLKLRDEIPKDKKDSIVESVVNQFKERSKRGIEKYGTTLQENNTDDFLQHFKEELMDAILYIQKLQSQRNDN